jgi:hypothetical protein
MASSFGPWATSMSTGNRVRLSTFWKRRMNMLPKIARLQPGSPSRGRWCLIVLSLALFALPTWFVDAQTPEAKTLPAQSQARSPQVDPPAVEFFPELSIKEQAIARKLDTPITFDFTDETLNGIQETIMDRHGFDIMFDKTNLEGESIATDAADVTVKVNEIPLRSALRLLLRTKKLAWVIEDDVLKITTETAYQGDRLTRTYPVRDLTGDEVSDFQSLMEAIRQGVTPGSWNETPHPGSVPSLSAPAAPSTTKGKMPVSTISMVPATGSLVIHQSWQGHDEVLKLLRALRKAKKLSPGK